MIKTHLFSILLIDQDLFGPIRSLSQQHYVPVREIWLCMVVCVPLSVPKQTLQRTVPRWTVVVAGANVAFCSC
jgi:hypothetical protein